MSEYRHGDRVRSTLRGYYYGLPGSISRPAQIQSATGKCYIIALDCGEMIQLNEKYIAPLLQDPESDDKQQTTAKQ